MSDEVYTIDELAERLKVGRDTIYRAIRNRTIHTIKVGKRQRITHAEFERILRDGTDGVTLGPVAVTRYPARTGTRSTRR